MNWTLYGSLADASGQPQAGTTVTVSPPGLPFTSGTITITKAALVTTDSNGQFTLPVQSVPGIVWTVQVAGEQPVTLPDPGGNASIDIRQLSPAYVPAWQGGTRVQQGIGISSADISNGVLTLGLSNGGSLNPVPLLTTPLFDADASIRPILPVQRALDNSLLRVAVLGDEWAERDISTGVGGRWQELLRDLLRRAVFPVETTGNDGGTGYVPAIYGVPGMPDAPITAGAVTLRRDMGGLGARSAKVGPNVGVASTITWPAQQCNRITLYYATDTVNNGSFDILVDGIVTQTVSCMSTTGRSSGRTWVWSGPLGNHTLSIRWNGTGAGTGSALVEGAHFSTGAAGVQWWDASGAGNTASAMANGPASALGSQIYSYQPLASVNPDLVIVALGYEDMGATNSATTWGNNLKQIVAQIKTYAPRAGILFLHAPTRLSDAANAPSKRLLVAYEDAAKAAIGNDPSMMMLFASRLWQPLGPLAGTATLDTVDPWQWLNRSAPTGEQLSLLAHDAISVYLASNIISLPDQYKGVYQLIQSASTAAAQAISAINSASSLIDGRAVVYFQPDAPVRTTSSDTHDIWFNTSDGNRIYIWNQGDWVLAQDQAIAQAVTVANNAAATANQNSQTLTFKISTYAQTTPPVSTTGRPLIIGDIWFDTSDGNNPKRWNGNAWASLRDSSIAATVTASLGGVQASIDAKATAYMGPNPPQANAVTLRQGDIWLNTTPANMAISFWDGTQWVKYINPDVATAQSTANSALTAASDTGVAAYITANGATQAALDGRYVIKTAKYATVPSSTTANRASASSAGAGAMYFDTTLNKPAWSDGTNWRDATGTTV